MQKLQTTKELTKDGKTKAICYGGDGKRAILRLMDEYIEQFTQGENGDWLFGGFSAAQLEGIATELKKRNSRIWRQLKKKTKRIYSRAINNASDEDEPAQALGYGTSQPSSGNDSDETVGSEPELVPCPLADCSCPDNGPCTLPDGP